MGHADRLEITDRGWTDMLGWLFSLDFFLSLCGLLSGLSDLGTT